MSNKIQRTPAREQNPKIRATNFNEVSFGYNTEEAELEASRCLNCKVPRCMTACPVSIKIPAFIHQVLEKNIPEAFRIISEDSSLPAVCGRVCPQETQCEGSCILGSKGEPVAIGKLERYVADWSRDNGVKFSSKIEHNGIKIAVIGSGPSGLACASDLAKEGYSVTIFEGLHKAGGVLSYGIPEFRLPKQVVVKHEIEGVKALGVKIETDVIVGRTVTVEELMKEENFKAVFVGTGAGLPRFLGIPGENLNGVFSANEFLTRNNLMRAFDPEYDTPISRGKEVCVVGGGNVAMDSARTALRLGAKVTVVYRRSEKELPARREEYEHAREEGIIFHFLSEPVGIIGNKEGWVSGLKCVKMQLGEPDESGRRKPVPIENSEFEINADTIIAALGTRTRSIIAATTSGVETDKKGRLVTNENEMTTREGIFAGGDIVTGAATVILAMGAGRKAAKEIDAYIKAKGIR